MRDAKLRVVASLKWAVRVLLLLAAADTRDMIGWPDSRFLGPVPAAAIEARATRIIWPRMMKKAE